MAEPGIDDGSAVRYEGGVAVRDPELVRESERVAADLERAWCQWRASHGQGTDPAPTVSSYVGYSLEEPWGEPRVVLGLAAADAEQLIALLDRHECALTPADVQGRESPPAPREAIPAPREARSQDAGQPAEPVPVRGAHASENGNRWPAPARSRSGRSTSARSRGEAKAGGRADRARDQAPGPDPRNQPEPQSQPEPQNHEAGFLALAASAARAEAEVRIRAALRGRPGPARRPECAAGAYSPQAEAASADDDDTDTDLAPAWAGREADATGAEFGRDKRDAAQYGRAGYEDADYEDADYGDAAYEDSGYGDEAYEDAARHADDDADDRSGPPAAGHTRRGRITRGYPISRLSRAKRTGAAVPGRAGLD